MLVENNVSRSLPGDFLLHDFLLIPGYQHPTTPAFLNRAGLLRWQVDGVSPQDVLLLSPGFTGGAGLFRHIAPAIVRFTGGKTAVWAVDRRSNLLEDRSGFLRGEAAGDPRIALQYYLSRSGSGHHALLMQEDVPWMAEWGLEVALEDLRCVVRRARRAYPDARILLGGHSLGGMLAQCYAASAFRDGVLGHTELDGLVLIDGAVRGQPCMERFHEQGAEAYHRLDNGERFWEDWGRVIAPLVSIVAGIAAQAGTMPEWQDRASLFLDLESDPASPIAALLSHLFAAGSPTNRALFGLGVDDATAPSTMARAHVGRAVAPADDLALVGWEDGGECGDLDAYGSLLRSTAEADGMDWYSPVRLNADLDMVQNLDSQTLPAAFKDRGPAFVLHNREVSLPVLAFVDTDHPVDGIQSCEWYQSSIASRQFTLRCGEGYAHMDPLVARLEENQFLQALIPWLHDLRRVT